MKLKHQPSIEASAGSGEKGAGGTMKLRFTFKIRRVEYGDRRVFQEYTVRAWDGSELVGMFEGLQRSHKTRTQASDAARAKIQELKLQPLFPVRVTEKCIRDGTGRSCITCAISQALWHSQESMGLPKFDYNFEVSPYAAFTTADGIRLENRRTKEIKHIAPSQLPIMVEAGYQRNMVEWAIDFDDWYDSVGMTQKEWREQKGDSDASLPYKPSPAAFVLNLAEFKPLT